MSIINCGGNVSGGGGGGITRTGLTMLADLKDWLVGIQTGDFITFEKLKFGSSDTISHATAVYTDIMDAGSAWYYYFSLSGNGYLGGQNSGLKALRIDQDKTNPNTISVYVYGVVTNASGFISEYTNVTGHKFL